MDNSSLLRVGMSNNIIGFVEDDKLTSLLFVLDKIMMRLYNDKLKQIYCSGRNIPRKYFNVELCVGPEFDFTNLYFQLRGTFPKNTTRIVLGVGEKGKVILGAY